MSHVVIYVPGLGDQNIAGRNVLVAGWRLYGVRPVVHQMNWADGHHFEEKLQSLLKHIDMLAEQGHTVSLVGESAGAGAAINAYAQRQDTVHRVACICGKLRNAASIHSSTYGRNPAFAESMAELPASLASLGPERLASIRSVKPLADPSVPPSDTVVNGAQSVTIPSVGHATSIVLGTTVFGGLLVGFLRKA